MADFLVRLRQSRGVSHDIQVQSWIGKTVSLVDYTEFYKQLLFFWNKNPGLSLLYASRDVGGGGNPQ